MYVIVLCLSTEETRLFLLGTDAASRVLERFARRIGGKTPMNPAGGLYTVGAAAVCVCCRVCAISSSAMRLSMCHFSVRRAS